MQQWDTLFKKEGKIFTKIQEDIPRILKLFREHNTNRILDSGCGSGRHTIYFSRERFDVYGIDISKEGIKITKSWLKKENLKASLSIGSIYSNLPYPDNFFDAVVCVQVLHHAKIDKIRKAIKEIERVLKEGGLIFITVTRSKYKARATKAKTIAPRTYMPLDGTEKGLSHFIYNKQLLRRDFKKFELFDLWIDSHNHYCLIGKLKK